MPSMQWEAVSRAGGLAMPSVRDMMISPPLSNGGSPLHRNRIGEQEFWSVLSPRAIFLAASEDVRSFLGWGPGEVMGRSLKDFIVAEEHPDSDDGNDTQFCMLREALWELHDGTSAGRHRTVALNLRTRRGSILQTCAVLYGPWAPAKVDNQAISRVVVQFKERGQQQQQPLHVGLTVHDPALNVFEELETTRETTWQYEVQQQRMTNRRLYDDVKEIETELFT